ncbi:MAG: leucine-rich repeat domain-containing protein, partial [Candidatus Marinimicrobia bacterium]|nr:leucine-rich repeat domain-containing protein [Candidatus Neomarinimicrobiota bacterium]
MKLCRKTIILLIFSSFMSVGWGQDCDNEEEIEIDSIEEICNLTDLTEIDLSSNGLTGEIPSCIGNLTNLTCLDLGSNELTGEIPSEIGNLTNLDYLNLGDNQLTGEIPSEIGNLTNLIFLGLSENQLNGEIPESICGLTNLNWSSSGIWYSDSYIYNNQLCSPYPECFLNQEPFTDVN